MAESEQENKKKQPQTQNIILRITVPPRFQALATTAFHTAVNKITAAIKELPCKPTPAAPGTAH